jgi:hypothetical protein
VQVPLILQFAGERSRPFNRSTRWTFDALQQAILQKRREASKPRPHNYELAPVA